MAKLISQGTMMVGILAVVAGLGAAFGVRYYLMQEEEAPAPPEKAAPLVMKVLVACTDLPADRVVSPTDVTSLPMTREQFDKQFKGVNPEEALLSVSSILHRRLREPMKKMQPFLTTKFYLEGTGPSIAKKLQPGYRAIRVEVPETRQAGVLIGMSVDVLFRANAAAGKNGQLAIPEKTLTLLRRIEVIDIERPAGARTAAKLPLLFTLAVPEDKVDMFGVIEGRGEVWLVPTPPKDKDSAKDAGAAVANVETLQELLGLKAPPRPAPPFETAIYRRGHMQINKFADGKLLATRSSDVGARFDEEAKPSTHATPMPPAIHPQNGSQSPQGEEVVPTREE
jgi:Flp pilus assembly protein CpaB